MSPHGDLGRVVNELELAGHGLEVVAYANTFDLELEESVVDTLDGGVTVDGGELLVGGVVWRSNIVRQEHGVGIGVEETNDIAALNIKGGLLLGQVGSREDDPLVIGVVVRVSGNLLSLGRDSTVFITEWVSGSVGVEIGFGILVAEGDFVVIVDVDAGKGHQVIGQGLLESRGHEIVTGSASVEDGKVDLEPEKVKAERNNDQSDSSGQEVVTELLDCESGVNVKETPEIDSDSGSNSNEGEGTDVFGGDDTGQGDTGEEKPLPPFSGERGVSHLVESDISEDGAGHGEDQGGIEQDQSGLANVGVIEENEAGSEKGGRNGVSALPHGEIDDRDSEGTKEGRHRAEGDIGDPVINVGVSDVIELEVAVKADEPAHEGEQELSEWRMDIEEVCPLEVERCELSKMNFIKHDFIRMIQLVESCEECKSGDNAKGDEMTNVDLLLLRGSRGSSICGDGPG